jgi:hypothetical protein
MALAWSNSQSKSIVGTAMYALLLEVNGRPSTAYG